MTKTEAKEAAQDAMMHSLQSVTYFISDNHDWNEREKQQVFDAFETQFRRIEKIFGYDPGSWGMGG